MKAISKAVHVMKSQIYKSVQFSETMSFWKSIFIQDNFNFFKKYENIKFEITQCQTIVLKLNLI